MSANETSRIVQEISNGSACKTLNSHDISGSKMYKQEECLAANKIDTLIKVEGSSRANDRVQNLDVSIFNISDICTRNDRCDSATNHIHPKIKKEMEDMDEIVIINESIIDIKLHPVSKIEELPDTGKNNMTILDEKCSDEPLKAIEEVPRETNLELQNEVPTLNWTLQSDFQMKLEPNLSEYYNSAPEEEHVNAHFKHEEMCQNQRNEDSIPFDCRICKKSFQQLCHLKGHRCLDTGERPFVCSTHGKEFTEQVTFTEQPVFYCAICGNLNKKKRTGEKPFVCTVCGKAFTHLSRLTVHKRMHTGEKPFVCTLCGKVLASLSSLTIHKRIHTGEKPYGCSTCGKVFRSRSNLIEHLRTHSAEKPFVCNICGKTFAQQGHLIGHKRTHTGEKPFGCSICGKVFTKQVYLTVHERIHTGEKPFGCSICGKVFTNHSNLTVHKRIHTGEKPFGCSTCGKVFTNQANLTVHKRIHTGEKPCVCNTCGKAFIHLGQLTVHKRVHTGEKPFGCSICGKVFIHQGNLTVHKRIHTGEKPFGCSTCGKVFRNRSNLTVHLKIHR